MGLLKREITITPKEETKTFIVTLHQEEEVDAKRIIDELTAMNKTKADREKDLAELPKQVEARTQMFEAELKSIDAIMPAFEGQKEQAGRWISNDIAKDFRGNKKEQSEVNTGTEGQK
jgi:hypothetical protein